MKYKRLTNSIDCDYKIYLAQEGLYNHFFGHKLDKKGRNKVNYIWKSLLKQFPERIK